MSSRRSASREIPWLQRSVPTFTTTDTKCEPRPVAAKETKCYTCERRPPRTCRCTAMDRSIVIERASLVCSLLSPRALCASRPLLAGLRHDALPTTPPTLVRRTPLDHAQNLNHQTLSNAVRQLPRKPQQSPLYSVPESDALNQMSPNAVCILYPCPLIGGGAETRDVAVQHAPDEDHRRNQQAQAYVDRGVFEPRELTARLALRSALEPIGVPLVVSC